MTFPSFKTGKQHPINIFTQEIHAATDIKPDDKGYMEAMNKKAQELELRNIMQGLEEFATFMSFRGNSAGLRILSVESVTQPITTKAQKPTARIIKMPEQPSLPNRNSKQAVNKSLSFQDRKYH